MDTVDSMSTVNAVAEGAAAPFNPQGWLEQLG